MTTQNNNEVSRALFKTPLGGLSPMFPAKEQVGYVIQVKGTAATIALLENEKDIELSRGPRWGDYLVIASDNYGCFGQVIELDAKESLGGASGSGTVTPVARLQLISSIEITSREVVMGIREYPKIGDPVFFSPDGLLQTVASLFQNQERKDKVLISVAGLCNQTNTRLDFTPETLLGRNLAIVGASGGGKSWTVAKLTEELCRFNSKVILVDATGGFATMGHPVIHTYLGEHPNPPRGSMAASIPYYELPEKDLLYLFRPSSDLQLSKLRAAIMSMKLIQLEPALAIGGNFIKSNRNKMPYIEAMKRQIREIETNFVYFDIERLVDQLKNECAYENRGPMEPDVWGNISPMDDALVAPLGMKMQEILADGDFSTLFSPGSTDSIFKILNWFIYNSDAKALCISLEYLSSLYSFRQIVVNALCRYLFSLSTSGAFHSRPVVLMVDEAQQFIGANEDGVYKEHKLNSMQQIAEEGRKYALNLCVATQRPRDLPEEMLNQIGAMIVHRLTHDRDMQTIQNTCCALDKNTLEIIPTLSPGEAVFLGIDVPIPLKMLINTPKYPPRLTGPDFQSHWS